MIHEPECPFRSGTHPAPVAPTSCNWCKELRAAYQRGSDDSLYWIRRYIEFWERPGYDGPNKELLRAIAAEFRMVLPWQAPKEGT